MKLTRLVSAIAVGGLLLAACSNGSAADSEAESISGADAAPAATEVAAEQATAEPTAAAPVAEATPDAAAIEAAPAALQFTAPLVGGGELDASMLAGKPTVFWFWAPN